MTEPFKSGLSFQTRITVAAMATAVGVLMVACALFTAEQWSAEQAGLKQHERFVAGALTDKLAAAADAGSMNATMQGLALSPRIVSAALMDNQGKVISTYNRARNKGAAADGVVESQTPVIRDGRRVGTLTLKAGSERMGSFLPRYLAITGALFFAATALSLFLGRILSKRVIEPVGRLSLVMEAIADGGDLGRRVSRIEDDEFGRLIESFNALLGRLEGSDRDLRHTLQDLMVARDAAESANVQKSQFLANMSHEIRTPLNGVLAMAQILDFGALNTEQREQVAVIRSSGEALLTILNDILDVSKIEAGQLELEIGEFDLERLIRATVASYDTAAHDKGVALTLCIADDVCGPRLGDAARVRQILSNLTSNAIKFTARGSVDVRIESAEQSAVRLIVTDTGVGMPEDKLPELFHTFTQLDGASTRRFGGTGLGLALCQELTAKMGGVITVNSTPGSGSVFQVDLPLPRCESATIETADEDAEQAPGRTIRVLAAEDNPTNQKVLSTILGLFGVDLQMVENGRLAVEAWSVTDPDIILMDIQMPEMDGVAAARAIRAAEIAGGRPRTPILAVTANAMAHQVDEYVAAGMDGLVSKPIEIAKLQAALEQAIAAKETASRAAA
jgi:signal transduction histidine kinase/ActR/RegA family two-component response regulator